MVTLAIKLYGIKELPSLCIGFLLLFGLNQAFSNNDNYLYFDNPLILFFYFMLDNFAYLGSILSYATEESLLMHIDI